MDTWTFLTDAGILLAAALVAGGLCIRLGQSPIIGYLLAGMFLGGPGSLQVVASQDEIQTFAELGVSLFLFNIGLEFSLARLASFPATVTRGALLQTTVMPLTVAVVAIACGLPTSIAVVLAMVLTLSSTACVLRSLTDRGEVDAPHGRAMLGVLLAQDLAVVPFALIVTILAGSGTDGFGLQVARICGVAAALVVGLYVFVNKIATHLLRRFSGEPNREFTVLLAVVVGIGSALATHAAGLSPALGAFAAGMFLGGSPFALQLRSDVAPLRVLLLTLFFSSVGMVADPVWILQNALLVLGLAFAVIVTKTLAVGLLMKLSGMTLGVAIAAALGLAQIGEFSFVLGLSAYEVGLIPNDLYVSGVSVAMVTMILAPGMVGVAPRFGRWIAGLLGDGKTDFSYHADPPPSNLVVVVGYGPAGRAVATRLVEKGVTVHVIDLAHDAMKTAGASGLKTFIGDGRHAEVLEHAGVPHARCVVVTIPSTEATTGIIRSVRILAPEAHIAVRSRYQLHHHLLEAEGAEIVRGDESVVGKSLARAVDKLLHGDGDGS